MIALILGTSEGKNILSLLNTFTQDIFVSTASSYGGEILKDYRYKVLNTKPLNKEELINSFKENKVSIVVDASHPYALEITQNTISACKNLGIEYVRYERPSVIDKFKEEKLVVQVEDYEALKEKIIGIDGNILNTTGSRNIQTILRLKLKNRIIHRVLPSVKVMDECLNLGVNVEDIIAIKGPVSYELNCAFIKEYEAKAILLKDSGVQGGTEEKLKAAIDLGIYAFVIERKTINYENIFYSEKEVVDYIKAGNA